MPATHRIPTNDYLQLDRQARAWFRNRPVLIRVIGGKSHGGNIIQGEVTARYRRKWLWDEERFATHREGE